MHIVGYHATDVDSVDPIKKHINIKMHDWINDLGNGFYCYVGEENLIDKKCGFNSPQENAQCYYSSVHKQNISKMSILKIECELNEENILNLSDLDNLANLNQSMHIFKKKALNKVFKCLHQSAKKEKGRRNRMVVDGFYIEEYINMLNDDDKIDDIDAVMMMTATDFDYCGYKKCRTHLLNGCELCIRNTECITSIKEMNSNAKRI